MSSSPILTMTAPQQQQQQPLAPVGHISLMIDTFIANSNVEDLRAVVRALLVTGPPNTTSTFQKVARQRLRRQRITDHTLLPAPASLFASYPSHDGPYSSSSSASSSSSLPSSISSSEPCDPHFTPQVAELVARARALFGAGLGLQSLPLLTLLIRGTHNLRWSEDGTFVDSMAILDSDIAQAIQSSFEEISSSVLDDVAADEGKCAVEELQLALKECENEVEAWGGEFPFQRGLANVEWLEQSDFWAKTMGRA